MSTKPLREQAGAGHRPRRHCSVRRDRLRGDPQHSGRRHHLPLGARRRPGPGDGAALTISPVRLSPGTTTRLRLQRRQGPPAQPV